MKLISESSSVLCRRQRFPLSLHIAVCLILFIAIYQVVVSISKPTSQLNLDNNIEMLNTVKQRGGEVFVDVIDLSKFASTCQTDDLFQLRRSKTFNTTTMVPMSQKASCPRKLTPASSKLPLTALLTFPGSGNTWARHLLQQMTGLPTGSVYHDKTLRDNGFPFEGNTTNVIVVKSHDINRTRKTPERIIVILRNVYEALLSMYKLYRVGHTASVYDIPRDSKWEKHVMGGSRHWDLFMKCTFSFKGPTLVVFYEDMKRDLLSQLIRIAEFVSHKDVSAFSFCCALNDSEGNHHRSKSNQTMTDLFDIEARKRINDIIDSRAKSLRERYEEASEKILTYKLPVNNF